jgi:prolyl-tRNA synthetase
VEVDDRPGLRPGAKFFHWERRGAPLRLEIGPRDVAAGQATAVTRHDGQKRPIPLTELPQRVQELLDGVQRALVDRARAFRESRTQVADDRPGIEQAVSQGYALSRWCGSRECAADIQASTRATIRCYPMERRDGTYVPAPTDPGTCAWCGGLADRRVIIARSY